jgi:hypothetical protein
MADSPRRFLQGASHGFVFDDIAPETPIEVVGMHPDEAPQSFKLPKGRPRIVFEIDNKTIRARPKLHHAVYRPADRILNLVFGVEAKMPRSFIPGIHKHIPLAVRIDDDAPLRYETPTTIRNQIKAGAGKPPPGPQKEQETPIHE